MLFLLEKLVSVLMMGSCSLIFVYCFKNTAKKKRRKVGRQAGGEKEKKEKKEKEKDYTKRRMIEV